jgi:TonB family protein
MGYQALLFCPDDKTARTVTQVLSELEFTVEACIEPFAAVKKLMGQHFDAVVVDCDNEQNATLLFKSARNSTSNQTSLAVAVVEGQAGVAKAFRIGANLVLTKPINIEQAKGTLRVARGLLRKSDPTKPGSATATGSFAVPTPPPVDALSPTPAPAPPKPMAPRPPLGGTKPVAPAAPRLVVPAATAVPPKPQPPATTVPKPTAPPMSAAWPAAASVAAQPTPAATNETPAAPVAEKAVAPAAAVAPPALYSAAVATPAPPKAAAPAPTVEFKRPVLSAPTAPVASGAASAPAPALEPPTPKIEKKASAAAEDLFEKPAKAVATEPAAYVGSAPSFTFGGSTAELESSGGSKKAIIGIAAALLIVAVGYFGWSHFKGTGTPTPEPAATTSAPASTPAVAPAPKPTAAQPAGTTPAATTLAPVSQPDITLGSSPKSSADENERSTGNSSSRAASRAASTASAPVKSEVAEKPETPATPALVVKGGKVPAAATKPAATPDAPAPSLIGMSAPADAPLPNLGTSETGLKPVLQTLSVSQGVSQGLLYKKVAPSYPQNALRMHIEGTVELLATISKEGNITHIKVVTGDPQLARAASDAVKQWKYKPYLLNGEPVEIQTGVTVNFKLPH